MKKECCAGLILVALTVLLAQRSAYAQAALETKGPYKVVEEEDPSLPNHTLYYPKNLAAVTGKLGVLAFGNGACANAGNAFERYLGEIASHGFLVVANGPIDSSELPVGRPPQPGTPRPQAPTQAEVARMRSSQSTTKQLYETMDWAQVQASDPKSHFFGKVDASKLAVSGQSCGGLQALEAAGDPRVKTAVIFNSGIFRHPPNLPGQSGNATATGASSNPRPPLVLPGSLDTLKHLHTPVIYIIGGKTDIAYENAEADFIDINGIPLFNANLTGVGHNGTLWEPDGGKFAQVATRWLLWQLNGDVEAEREFSGADCGLCVQPDWTVKRKGIN
jgi:hypothetical protein